MPLRSIETQNTDAVEWIQAQLWRNEGKIGIPPFFSSPSLPLSHFDKSFSCSAALVKVLLVGIHLPLPLSLHTCGKVISVASNSSFKQLQHCLRSFGGHLRRAVPDTNRFFRLVRPPLGHLWQRPENDRRNSKRKSKIMHVEVITIHQKSQLFTLECSVSIPVNGSSSC